MKRVILFKEHIDLLRSLVREHLGSDKLANVYFVIGHTFGETVDQAIESGFIGGKYSMGKCGLWNFPRILFTLGPHQFGYTEDDQSERRLFLEKIQAEFDQAGFPYVLWESITNGNIALWSLKEDRFPKHHPDYSYGLDALKKLRWPK